MKHLILVISIITLSITYIHSQSKVNISGTVLKNEQFEKVYLDNIITQTALDSADIDKSGKFSLNSSIEKSDFYKLRFNQEYYLLLVLNPGENVKVEVDITNMYAPIIKGSHNSELVYTTFGKMKDFYEKQKRFSEQVEKEKKEYLRNFVL